MENGPALISIIIPIYNTEKYLSQCIESVINQTYRNLEIILVDDGAEDASPRICDEYASKDKRIVVIHQENQGVAQARNNGIAIARGAFITFIDGDDWVDPEMCESMMNALEQYQVQSAMCAYIREYPEASLPRILHSENTVWDGRAFQRRICGPIGEELRNPENLDCYVMMCGKLYPHKAVKGIRVTDLRLIGSSEDALYNFEAFSNIENIVYLNTPFYHYRKALSGSVSGRHKPDLEGQWNNLYDMMKKLIDSDHLDEFCTLALNNRIALNVIGLGLNSVSDKTSFREKSERIKKVLSHPRRSAALKQLSLRFMPIHWKTFFFCAKHRISFAVFALLLIMSKLKGKV